jgi:hypothetical protein
VVDDEDAARKRRRGTIGGLTVIAFGLIGAIIIYFSARNPMNFFRWMYAADFAILHAVLWTLFGLGLILWHNRPPTDPSRPFDS